MGSFKSKGRDHGLNRRRGKASPGRQGSPRIESLEDRCLLSGANDGLTPLWEPTSTDLLDAQHGPMADLGVGAVDVYKAYIQGGDSTANLQAQFPLDQFQDGKLGIQLKSLGGDFTQYLSQLTDVGMQVTSSSAYYGLVEGYAPVNELPAIAQLSQTQSGIVNIKPTVSAVYQGAAYNEAMTSMAADTAQTQFKVTGAGVTVGVLSDSVSEYKGGLSDSYKTGDLNPNQPVDVIQDGTGSNPTDEGRAMLENIHDIAPGAGLAFAQGISDPLTFHNNIIALANQAKAGVIVDDLGFSDDPFFQDGLVAQAIDTVTAQGVTYFSSAGNDGAANGYLSPFRASSGTVAGIGSGTFMNFNPSGGTTLELPITTYVNNANLDFQYDQPFETQEPAGSPGKVTSNVYIYVLDSSGNVVVGASANNNNVAIQQPYQFITIPSAGTYSVVVQVVSGTNPGYIEFASDNDNNTSLSVSQQFGTAGGVAYPSSHGHNTAAANIGVGATPWWATSPFLGQTPLANEPFSSSGPAVYDLNVDGTPRAAQFVQNPTITAPDGGNTSFFIPDTIIKTSDTPPYWPGEPSTSTNLSQDLPSFFGTSSAAPNAAAVAALMKQLVPTATPAQIRASLIVGATPMNGAAPGSWNPQSGYGLVNAVNSLNAIDQLRVSTTTPANGTILTSAPSVITVTFNKPVVASSLSPADLTFISAPAGVFVNVGSPIPVDSPTNPTIVAFPVSFFKAPGVVANGNYAFTVHSPAGAAVVSKDGKALVASNPISFTLADTTAPTIVNTSISGRAVSIQFSKAVDPGTVNLSSILVLRQAGGTTWPPNPANIFTGGYIDLNGDPRTTISYNPLTFTVTLDYTNLPQTEMPSDNYAIVAISPASPGALGVTDLVGNRLNGYFTGSFPTTSLLGQPFDFIQNLGYKALQAPTITTFTMDPTSDTGLPNDQNTDQTEPTFIGQIYVPFPGSVAGDRVYVQFSGESGGATNLTVGGTTVPGATTGRGYTGGVDVTTTTDASGTFTVTAPTALPQGFQSAAAVVVGQADLPPLPGLSSLATDNFRVDATPPQIIWAAFSPGGPTLPLPNGPPPNVTNISSLSTLTLGVVDWSVTQPGALPTPSTVLLDALDPATVKNVGNYSLINTTTNTDESQYITGATFVPATVPPGSGYYTAYTGTINLTFATGLPSGRYEFIAHTHELQYPGLADAAGNYLDDTPVAGEGTRDFIVNFALQTTPTYITNMAMESSYTASGSTAVGGPQSYYELPGPAGNTRDNVSAPPTTFVIDLSNPIPYVSAGYYSNKLLLVRSANTPTAAADGDFGTLGEGGLGATGTGFTVVPGTSVTLYNYAIAPDGTVTSTQVPAGGLGNRLVLTIPAGTTLAADYYRLYLPNAVEPNGTDARIKDVYGNQLDGEFLGAPTSQGSREFRPSSPLVGLSQYADELPDGSIRQPGMSGDGAPGGAFMTGFAVVPYGNVVYARPDYVENSLLGTAGLSDGSMARPYPVLAPEGDPASLLSSNPTHDPNLGLNNPAFFQPANFNLTYDLSGDNKYEQSALYAASQLAFKGPVVVVAEAGLPTRSPITGQVNQASYSLVAPAGNANGGSASVPFDTTLIFQAGSALKLQGASLFVQDQGSALQAQGTLVNPVVFTSYNDTTVGGATNGNPDTEPHGGDWGGIVYRNYDDAIVSQQQRFPVDGILAGLNGAPAISGAQDAMSILNFANVKYAGGAVPAGSSTFYSGITLYNARPMVVNSQISGTGGTGGTEGAIGADMDSLREDDTARGPLIRFDTTTGNSINGLYLMAETNGYIEPTNAITYPSNPTTLGGAPATQFDPSPYSLAYTLDEPLPVVILAQLIVGQELLENTGGQTADMQNRLYIQPGSILKFNKGSGLDVIDSAASLNVGSRSYINGFDRDPSYGPGSAGFVAESATDPHVIFTSIYDDTASTRFVPPINVTGEATAPTLGPSMWGSVGVITGADVVINSAVFRYGGGSINTQGFTLDSQSVLAFITSETFFSFAGDYNSGGGTHAYITNNDFFDNFDAAMQIEPNGLLAGDPVHPLASGHPFFRGNVMQGNGIDGLAVVTDRAFLDNASTNWNYIGPVENNAGNANGLVGVGNLSNYVNQTVDAVWDATDLTYVLRGTVVLGSRFFRRGNGLPTPNTSSFTTVPAPTVTLTIQAALPGTLLADGSTIPNPGQSVIVKMLNDNQPLGAGDLTGIGQGSNVNAGQADGAGFSVGVDNGEDPTTDPLIDQGVGAAIRLLGIPGNQTTGQQRVPVILTSLRDDTVGTTVRGVQMYNILNSLPTFALNPQYKGQNLTTPKPGDGGILYVGGLSQASYDMSSPFQGSIISNADISYMTRIEVQGGGIINYYNDISKTAGTPSTTTADWWDQLSGYLAPVNQLNTPMTLTIAGSNLADFSDAAVFAHPNTNAIVVDWTGANGSVAPAPVSGPTRGSLAGEPVFLYMYNDTVSNSGEGVHINSQTGNDSNGDSVFQAVIENVTFYNDGYAIHTIAPAFSAGPPPNDYASVEVLAMNDIFDGSSNVAVQIEGQAGFSQLQYNLFFDNKTNIVATTNDGDFAGNIGASYGDPQFVGPAGPQYDASAQNFEIKPTSPAIDAGRSEIGPLAGGNAIYPGDTITLSNGRVIPTRIDPANPAQLPPGDVPGKSDLFGEFGGFSFNRLGSGFVDPRQIITLPGSSAFTFPDQWQPVLTSNPDGYSGTSSNAATYNYQAYSGIRDILGYIRLPDPAVPGVGYGSNPFIDIGAYQYVNLHPPQVTAVTATVPAGTSTITGGSTIPFYTVNGKVGSSTTPATIDVTFSEPINPATLTAQTVQLEEMGIVSGTKQQFISLAGKLSYNSATNTLVIHLADAGVTLPTDEYRVILVGTGSPVIQNTLGIALDGENLSNGDDPATGVEQPLPSGNGFPGGDFYDTFIINATAPVIVPGSLQMSPSSDSNIVGDNVTAVATPTFTGSITEPNPNLVPLSGQTAILDIGVALIVNGTTQYFFDPSQLPAGFTQYASLIRPNAATGLTDNNGIFSLTVGSDAANSGLAINPSPLANLQGLYNVGGDGILSTFADDNVYYVARARVVDQSGNQSPAAGQVNFVVDDTPPTVAFTGPTNGQVITSLPGGAIQFTLVTSENIDLTHFTASSVMIVGGGPDGVLGTSDDVTIPINPQSIQVSYLDRGTGGQGREQIAFSTGAALGNGPYAIAILNTGAGAVRDIAGNLLASPYGETFTVAVPSLVHTLYVGGPGFVTDSTAAAGTRENPYPSIAAAMTAATAGDVVAVLPGVYTENVTLRQFVRLLSADPLSTDSTVFTTSTGDPLSTIIRAPAGSTNAVTVSASDLQSAAGLETEIAGFTIAAPLVGDPAKGFINPNSVGIGVVNSNLVIDKDYVADAGTGISIYTQGGTAAVPQLYNDVIVGNGTGVAITDNGGTPVTTPAVSIVNSDFAFNTNGLYLVNSVSSPVQASVANDIFWQNRDQSNARNGIGIYSTTPDKIYLRNNLFQGNGPDTSMTANPNATNNLGNGFSPLALNSTAPDALGNFVGDPAFAFPIDPRPGSDGPANLFVSSDFGLTAKSAAIDNADEAVAVPTDLLGASEVKIGGYGWGLPGYGPRDIGAYEYGGVGGISVGGAFRVVTSSLVPVGGAPLAGGGVMVTPSSPSSITLKFSRAIDPHSISATDLLLSGSADGSAVHATSLTWIDKDTVQFNLSGPLSLPGTLSVALAANQIRSIQGQGALGYSDSVVLQIGTPTGNTNPTPYPVIKPIGSSGTTPTPKSTSPSPTTGPVVVTLSNPVAAATTPAPAASPVSARSRRAASRHAHHAGTRHAAAHHHHHPKVKHPVKTKAAHPKATTSLALSLAGLHKKTK